MSTNDEIIRSMIRHEHELLNNRMSWMNTLHGLLFAALGVAWKEDFLPIIISAVGIAVSVITLFGAFAATIEICRLSDWWDANKPGAHTGPGVTGMPVVMQYKYLRLFAPWNFLPLIFLVAWMAVVVEKSG